MYSYDYLDFRAAFYIHEMKQLKMHTKYFVPLNTRFKVTLSCRIHLLNVVYLWKRTYTGFRYF